MNPPDSGHKIFNQNGPRAAPVQDRFNGMNMKSYKTQVKNRLGQYSREQKRREESTEGHHGTAAQAELPH